MNPTLEFSDSLNDPPPIPPQRFRPSDDTSAQLLRQRRPQNDRARLQIRRHSSVDGMPDYEIQHVQQGSRDYAVVNLKAKKNSVPDRGTNPAVSEAASQRSPVRPRSPDDRGSPIGQRSPVGRNSPISLLSPVGRNSPIGQRSPTGQRSPKGQRSPILPPKQKSLDTGLDQQKIERADGSPKPHRRGGEYIQLQFQKEPKEKPSPDLQLGRAANAPTALPRDVKTKFAYSTIVFEKEPEKDLERAQDLKKKKAPPPLPPKYDSEPPHKGMKKFQSDSHMAPQNHKGMPGSKPTSLPDLVQDEDRLEQTRTNYSSPPTAPSRHNHVQQSNGVGGPEDESGYVMVSKHEIPQVPPR